MRYLSLAEVLDLQHRIIEQSGGSHGLQNLGALESALAQPKMAFGGTDLYPTLFEKAAALCDSLVLNHPFVDGNKRVGHAAMETFLILNGYELNADVDDAETTILKLAAGDLQRDHFTEWVVEHTIERGSE